ncbi:MAG: type IV secretion system protein VirB10 [Sutterellaceae bacterium]|nr:type IV secretion system protein VirB10 [Sutterellaceae bacterium]MDD7441693.1 type IV secretion system protein VirB10 [Sutterellaceae bacterium]MDY2868712.1 type IV secretion system protein VirB10 [Mesosutterella sp.]
MTENEMEELKNPAGPEFRNAVGSTGEEGKEKTSRKRIPHGIPGFSRGGTDGRARAMRAAGVAVLAVSAAVGAGLLLKISGGANLSPDPIPKEDAALLTSRRVLKLPSLPAKAPAEEKPAAPAAAAPSSDPVPSIAILRNERPAPAAADPRPEEDPRLTSPLFPDEASGKAGRVIPIQKGTSDDRGASATPFGLELLRAAKEGEERKDEKPVKAPEDAAAKATRIPDRSFTLLKGTPIGCLLETRLDTSVPGATTCVIPRDVWSADGRVKLVEKGSRATGEYRGSASHGSSRIFVLWNEIVTPEGVRISVRSPGTDSLGAAGTPGDVDRHWFERFGNALLFSVIEDGVEFGTAKAANTSGDGVNVYQNTSNSTEAIVKEALRAAGDIPPTITLNQGARIGILTSRDLDFRTVYRVKPVKNVSGSVLKEKEANHG